MKQHIYISLLATAALLVTIMITLSVIMVSDVISNNYIDMAEQKLERSISRSKNYVNSGLLTAGNLSTDSTIISELLNPKGNNLTSLLDNACQYAMKTQAITVYSTDGRIYSSSGISDIPTLEILDTNDYLHDFFIDPRSEDISMRTDVIANTYGDMTYNEAYGIISCCKKIYRGSTVIGYIFSDIFPSNVYKYFDWSNEKYFSESVPALGQNGSYFPYEDNAKYQSDFSDAHYSKRQTSDKRYLIIPSDRNVFGGTVNIAVPLYPLYNRITMIGAMLSAIGIGILIGVHFIAKGMANSILTRLQRLHDKMEREGNADIKSS